MRPYPGTGLLHRSSPESDRSVPSTPRSCPPHLPSPPASETSGSPIPSAAELTAASLFKPTHQGERDLLESDRANAAFVHPATHTKTTRPTELELQIAQITQFCERVSGKLILPYTTLTLYRVHDPYTLLYNHLPAKARANSNPKSHTLTITLMVSPQHEAVTLWADSTVTNWEHDGILTKAERKMLQVGGMSCRLHTGLYRLDDSDDDYEPPSSSNISKRKRLSQACGKHKPEALRKEADFGIRPRGANLPCVVFEVGWTQKEASLREDAEQWLIKGGGRIRVCILVGIEEYELPKGGIDGLRNKARALVEQDIEGVVEPDQDDVILSSPPSDATDASIALNNIDPDLWVGKLRVWVEMWRYDDRTKGINLTDNKRWIAQDEVNPDMITPTGENPCLNIADLFPIKPTHRGRVEPEAPHWHEGDDRRMILDLQELRNEISLAKNKYAVDRAEVAWESLRREFAL